MSSRFIVALKLSVFGINGNVVTSKECTDTVLSIQKHILSKQILKKAFSGKKHFFFRAYVLIRMLRSWSTQLKKKNLTQQNFVYFEAPKQYNPLLKGDVPSFAERALRFSA